jgi:hypothetical protein
MSAVEIQNRILAVIGRKGTGKSSELERMLESEDRILVFDSMAEHDWSPNEIDSPDRLEEFFRWNRKREQWAANYVPGEDIEQDLERVSDLVFDRGHLVFAIEEVPLMCSPGYLPAKFGKLVRTGRHKQVDIFWTAQRAGEVSRTLTSLTDEFIFFSQTEPRDLDAIAARCGAEVAEKVSHLDGHDHILWDVKRRRLVESARAPLRPAPEGPSIEIIQ